MKFAACSSSILFPLFILVMLATYLGFMPTVTLAEGLTATTFIATFAFLMAVGGIFFWLGDTIPIVNKYLGGACVLSAVRRVGNEAVRLGAGYVAERRKGSDERRFPGCLHCLSAGRRCADHGS